MLRTQAVRRAPRQRHLLVRRHRQHDAALVLDANDNVVLLEVVSVVGRLASANLEDRRDMNANLREHKGVGVLMTKYERETLLNV